MISQDKEISDSSASLIVEAIIEQAIKDYEFALKYKDIEPENKNQEAKKG